MCGILVAYNKKFTGQELFVLSRSTEERGSDGFGFCNFSKEHKVPKIYKTKKSYTDATNDVIVDDNYMCDKNQILMANFRARPETEVETSEKNMQPIIINDVAVIHNGAISEGLVSELKNTMFEFQTEIDSEAIIHVYNLCKKDIVKTCEKIDGGFAFVLYDHNDNILYCCNKYHPFAYNWDGESFIGHSNIKALEYIYPDNNYELEPNSIIKIDLNYNELTKYNFKSKYTTSMNLKIEKGKEKYIVIASGGIDSGSNIGILSKLKKDISILHFNYGQKGSEAEVIAVRNLCKYFDIHKDNIHIIDLRNFYQSLNSVSSLLNKDIKVKTGDKNFIKTTTAWVEGRNLIFGSMAIALAENYANKGYEKVYIASGWNQLSEEGFYPDNSYWFSKYLNNLIGIGTLVGKDRIKFLPLLKNLLKSDEWLLAKYLGYLPSFGYTISCDIPEVHDGIAYNCNGQCGSTILSINAAKIAGVKDPRILIEVEGYEKSNVMVPNGCTNNSTLSELVHRLILDEKDKDILLGG